MRVDLAVFGRVCRAGRRLRAPAAFAFMAFAFVACATSTDNPTAPVANVALRLCPGGSWFAYRNEGGAWTHLPGQNGTFEFVTTERLAIAMARPALGGASSDLRVNFVTATQAEAVYGCRNATPTPVGRVSAVVRGRAADEYAEVSYGGSAATVGLIDSTTLLVAYAGATDLVATRFTPRAPDHADRVIVRRAQNYPAGASIAVDFSSSEAAALAEHVLTWNGSGGHVQVNYRTATGNNNVLQSTLVGVSGSGDMVRSTTLYSIPSARQVSGDIHELYLGQNQRAVTLFYRDARDRSLTVGPPASRPTFTTLATSPYVRLKVDIASQPEYDASVNLLFQQAGALVSIGATKEYFGGTPQTWSLTIPDLSGIEGFDGAAGLKPGRFDWSMGVTSQPFVFAPLLATDGLVVRSASGFGQQP